MKYRDELFPEIEPYKHYMLPVSDVHSLYIEESGNPDGCPILFVHGGPGAGIAPIFRRFFDPEYYRIILFDQRGTGKSIPHAETSENTTWDLVADMEKIRKQLNIKQWVIFGGSWGSTLTLVYAISHPERVMAMILRGIFLGRKKEIDWIFQEGASLFYPEKWEKFLSIIPDNERSDLLHAYWTRVMDGNPEIHQPAALAWSKWEGEIINLLPKKKDDKEDFEDEKFALAMTRLETHYFVNGNFFPEEDYIVNNCHKIQHIPCSIIQGRYDIDCPPASAWELHRALPQSELFIVPDAGHSSMEPGNIKELVKATERYKATVRY